MFDILIHRKALKEIDGLPAEDMQRILGAIREMATDPFVRDGPSRTSKVYSDGESQKNSTRAGNDSEVRAFYEPKCAERSCL